ncbi:uncharacterized protein LOC128393047 [Panonychus citri]|uniref:uncharacterized protein LOC128393047 n=1 Tax=Panonychus citri TaxID=50023 RepID=UPI002308116A|nr:uncharacterized protein LOC128393047 [Panonychus citri]
MTQRISCEIKSTTGSSTVHQQTIGKSSSSSRSMPTISSPFIQGWLRRQLIPVIIRSKVNDSKSSWKGSVDLSTSTMKTNANEYTNMSKLSATINNNINSSNCAINNLTNNLHSNCFTPNHQSPLKSKLIDNSLELQSQSAPCTPKFMMKRPPPLETIYSTPMTIDCGEIDFLSRQLTEKDKILTELRLELLSTEDQIEELRELIGKLGKQLVNLREENKRLNNLVDSLTTLSCYKLSRVNGQSSKINNQNTEQSTTITI